MSKVKFTCLRYPQIRIQTGRPNDECICFGNGSYTTSDPEEIKILRNRPGIKEHSSWDESKKRWVTPEYERAKAEAKAELQAEAAAAKPEPKTETQTETNAEEDKAEKPPKRSPGRPPRTSRE